MLGISKDQLISIVVGFVGRLVNGTNEIGRYVERR